MFAHLTKEFRYNWKLAAPVIMGMLGHTFVGFVDNIMVGQLGSADLAAVSLGNSFFFVAMSFGIGFSTAITHWLQKQILKMISKKESPRLSMACFYVSSLSLLLYAMILLAKPLMYFMEQPEEVVVLAMPYLNIVAISLIPLIIFQGFKQFSDGLSLTKHAMYATLFANILNVGFNYLLIFGKFGFPEMGIVGAGIGTLNFSISHDCFDLVLLKNDKKAKAFVTHDKTICFG